MLRPLAVTVAVLAAGALAVLTLMEFRAGPAPGERPVLTAPGTYHVKPPGGRKRPERDKRLHIRYAPDDPDAVGEVGPKSGHLTMDVSAAKDVLRLKKFGSGCTNTADLVVVCDVGTWYDSWAGWSGALPYAAPGSKAGDSGRLRMTYEAPDGHVATATTRVVVGGPILEVRAPKVVDGIRPGAETSMDLAVRNTGETTAHGIALLLTVDNELPLSQHFANCRYSGADRGAQTAYCTFPDLRLPPGRTVVFGPGLRMRTPKVIDHADLRQSAWPLDLGPYEAVRMTSPGPAGDGPRLEPVVRAGGRGAWSDDAEVWTMVHTDNPADYAAIGDRVAGAPGDVRDVRIGARNDGPGDPGQGGAFDLVFTPPRGSTVVKEPMQEIDDDVFEPLCRHKGDTYTCPSTAHEPGEERTLTFTLRLAAGDGDGLVRLKPRGAPDERTADPDPSDNTARVVVVPAEAAPPAARSDTLAWTVGAVALAGVTAVGALLLRRRARRASGARRDSPSKG
ncbi:hypothetical protein ACIBL6_11740 [Streptomyces sp. NPDC050400]|uniref:hypothetical protein n=1 Tax=Streptomyces sp. NPDC050400 TaxID=3365610 RepID=UPI0037B54E7E